MCLVFCEDYFCIHYVSGKPTSVFSWKSLRILENKKKVQHFASNTTIWCDFKSVLRLMICSRFQIRAINTAHKVCSSISDNCSNLVTSTSSIVNIIQRICGSSHSICNQRDFLKLLVDFLCEPAMDGLDNRSVEMVSSKQQSLSFCFRTGCSAIWYPGHQLSKWASIFQVGSYEVGVGGGDITCF